MSSPLEWFRALRQYPQPYNGPWPRAGEHPFSANAWFTNPDPRMRPTDSILTRQPRYVFLPGQTELTVTPYNFPALHAQFQRMQRDAGIAEPYRLVIGQDVAGKAAVSGRTRTVSIDLGLLNRSDFNGFQFWLGHEIAHVWQVTHPRHERIPIRDSRVAADARYESEADIFAYCLTGDRASILRGMNGLSQEGSDTHAPRAARQGAVQEALWTDCMPFNINRIPHYLRRAPERR